MILLAHQLGHKVTSSDFVAPVTPGVPVGTEVRWANRWNNTLGNWRWIQFPRVARA